MSRQDDLKQLIAEHYRHLHILKLQEAGYSSLNVPTHILTQIQDREVVIEKLQAELTELERKVGSPDRTRGFIKEPGASIPPPPARSAESEPATATQTPVPRQPESKPASTKLPQVPSPQHPFEPELILIPAGEFLMGSDPKKDKKAHKDELPQHKLYLPDYSIAKTPVTNAQYATFVQATGYGLSRWRDGRPPTGQEDHPVVDISWMGAVAYCRWLAQVTGKPYRLPTEAEWEKAARGSDGRIYPWGNKWDAQCCNTKKGGNGGITPVGSYLAGASPYRVLDMAGNVWEWCATKWHKPYPYDATEDEWTDDYLNLRESFRVLRGGSWSSNEDVARCAYRGGNFPYFWIGYGGCRVVVSPIL